jgi:hypothetical protein
LNVLQNLGVSIKSWSSSGMYVTRILAQPLGRLFKRRKINDNRETNRDREEHWIRTNKEVTAQLRLLRGRKFSGRTMRKTH